MSSYDKVRGGSLSFKNGGSLAVKKKKKKKDKKASDEALELALEERRVGEGIGGAPGGDAKSDYEDLFPAEKKRQADAKGRSNCWGTNYREAPDVLHGYTESWKGKKSFSAEERLDLRAASKADKFLPMTERSARSTTRRSPFAKFDSFAKFASYRSDDTCDIDSTVVIHVFTNT